MRIAFGSDDQSDLGLVAYLRERGHDVAAPVELGDPWPDVGRTVGEAVAGGGANLGIVCCWTGTGVTMAANKVPGVRAALCADAETARGARRWNDANVLALSLRSTSPAVLEEILDGWFEAGPSEDDDDVANVRHVDQIG